MSAHAWELRTVPEELKSRYLTDGFWSDSSIGEMVAHGLASKGAAAFVIHSKVRPWRGTMAEVHHAAKAFAATLRSRGVGPGDVVLFQLPNWVEAAITFWGAAYVGAVVVPVVHFYGPKELAYILEVTRPEVVVTADRFGRAEYLDSYEEMLAGSDALWLVVGDTPADQLPSSARAFQSALDSDPVERPAPVDLDSPAVIAFTSGTTRNPKGVIHSHHTIGYEARQLTLLSKEGTPPAITGAPVGHFIGMLGSLLSSLLRAETPIHFVDVWDPAEVLRIMLAEGLSMGGGSTYFLTSLIDHPDFTDAHLALMPYCGLGGSAVPISVTERATKMGITVYRSYGSTEHPSATGSNPDTPQDKRLHTDGLPMPGTELRLDEDGEIFTRGAELFLGYTDPELTAAAFDDEGWYRTGDVGTIDEDGYLSITDRISDIIIRGGENISAQEVEEILLEMPALAEAYVVAAPDDRLGEHAAAVVRVREACGVPTLEDVREHFASVGVARQKWPEALYTVGDFPRTPSGKVQKFKLREQLRNGELGHTV